MQKIHTDRYEVTVTSDSRFDLSKDVHEGYDYILNPDSWQPDENYTAAKITVTGAAGTSVTALLGPIESDFSDCAVLAEDTLYVLMGSSVTAIALNALPSHSFFNIEADGYTHGLYRCGGGFLIVCTYGLLMCDEEMKELWHYDTDAPVTSCVMEENRIVLIDEDDNRHHVGYNDRRTA